MKLFSSPVSCFDKLVIESSILSCLTCNEYILNVLRGPQCDKNTWLFKFSAKVYHCCKVWHHFLTNAIFFFFAQKGEFLHDGNATSLLFVKQSSFPGNSPENECKNIIALCNHPTLGSLSFVCYFHRDRFWIGKFKF